MSTATRQMAPLKELPYGYYCVETYLDPIDQESTVGAVFGPFTNERTASYWADHIFVPDPDTFEDMWLVRHDEVGPWLHMYPATAKHKTVNVYRPTRHGTIPVGYEGRMYALPRKKRLTRRGKAIAALAAVTISWLMFNITKDVCWNYNGFGYTTCEWAK